MKPTFVSKAKITKQGQITVPLEARQKLGLPDESDLFWYEIDGILVASPVLLSLPELEKKLRGKK